MNGITQKDIDHIANLARVKLSEKERATMTEEVGRILTYVQKLGAVDTSSVEPTAQVTGLENVFRTDINPITASVKRRDVLLTQVPITRGGSVEVKPVLEAK